MDKLSTCVFQVSPLYQTLSLLHLWLIWLYGLQLLWLSWHASFEIIFSYILYGMDALELDVFNVDVLDVDAAVECWTSKPKGYQTENKRYHSILWSLLLLFALCLALDWILFFCFFGLFDAQARADEIEALKKAKLTLAGDCTHSSRFLNEPKLQTFEQLGRPQITWSLLTLVERPLGCSHDLGKSCLARSTKSVRPVRQSSLAQIANVAPWLLQLLWSFSLMNNEESLNTVFANKSSMSSWMPLYIYKSNLTLVVPWVDRLLDQTSLGIIRHHYTWFIF